MAWNVLGAAALTEVGMEVFKKVFMKAGDAIGEKIVNNFGGENNPIDEKLDMKSSDLMDPAKRLVWDGINRRMNEKGGDGFFASRSRKKMATTRRMNFAAMMDDPPTIKVDEKNDKGKVVKTTHTPDPNFRPLATKVKEFCVDIFIAEQQAQVSGGKSNDEATNIAQEKVEIYLRDAGFPIATSRNGYRHVDEFITNLPDNALAAAKTARQLMLATGTSIVNNLEQRGANRSKKSWWRRML